MKKDYYGLPIQSIHNPFLTLDYLTEAGPRLVGLYLNGNPQNLLAELPDLIEKTPYGEFHFLGGHRLWHAPEAFPRTYIPDNQGLVIEDAYQGVKLRGALETATGIQKIMQIELLPEFAGSEDSSRDFQSRSLASGVGCLGVNSAPIGRHRGFSTANSTT